MLIVLECGIIFCVYGLFCVFILKLFELFGFGWCIVVCVVGCVMLVKGLCLVCLCGDNVVVGMLVLFVLILLWCCGNCIWVFMLWLSEIKFFFDYFESVFEVVICVCFVGFGVVVDGLFCYIVFCCVYDVCKCVDIKFMYIVDVEVKDEVVVFKCIVGKLYCGVMFDMVYYFVMKVFEYVDFLCLVVIGMGLCGLFVGLIFV